MRSLTDLVSARAVAPLAFLDGGFGILEAIVIVIVVGTGAFLCLVAFDLNTHFQRFDKRDSKRAASVASGATTPKRIKEQKPASKVPLDKAMR